MARYEHGGITGRQRRRSNAGLTRAFWPHKNIWRGAMYLAGYAVECRLKARLMEMYSAKTLADLEALLAVKSRERVNLATHSIEYLFGFAGVDARLVDHGNPAVLHAYRRCNTWKTSWRYNPRDGTKEECDIFLEAIDTFSRFIQTST